MKVLNNEEMLEVEGGGLGIQIGLGIIGGVIAFLAGFVDGIIHPKKCN